MWLDRLKEMKKISGKTSQSISDETGIPKSTIDKLFAGRTKEPYLLSTKKIVHCMGFTLDDLDENYVKTLTINNLSADEQKLLSNYSELNDNAKSSLIDYSDYIASKPENKKNNPETNKMNA